MTQNVVEPVAIIGGGPAGMATAMAFLKVGIPAKIYERYPEPRAAGNIVNLWPPAVKALEALGVDTNDLGASCRTEFRSHKNKVRVRVKFPDGVVEQYGGFLGLTRPDLYARMLDGVPAGTIVGNKELVGLVDQGDKVALTFKDGTNVNAPLVIGADGLNSIVRDKVWGLPPIREHELHVVGGYTFNLPNGVKPDEAILRHSRTVQASHTGIRSQGRDGSEWWVLQSWDPEKSAPADLKRYALDSVKGFPTEMAELIAGTEPEHIFRWPIRDRGVVPTEWSKGRVTFAGDSIHPTSPYAAYGAGMAIGDGYFLGQLFRGVDLGDLDAVKETLLKYEDLRVEHTASQVKLAHMLGRNFHKVPAPMRPLRDFVFNNTKMLQKLVGDSNPAEISAQLEVMGEDLFHPATHAIPDSRRAAGASHDRDPESRKK